MEEYTGRKACNELDNRIIGYFRMSEGDEKDEKRKALLERTGLLFYLFPIDECWLTREDAAEFFRKNENEVNKAFDSFISGLASSPDKTTATRVGGLTYTEYLKFHLRRQCTDFIVKKDSSPHRKKGDSLVR